MSRKNRVIVFSTAALVGAAVIFFANPFESRNDVVKTIRQRATIDRTPQPNIETLSQDVLSTNQAAPIAAKSVKLLLSDKEENQLQALHEILTSKNDNDPRLDSELKELTPNLRNRMRTEYASIRREKLNDRGTLVFLLGRNLKTREDFAFMSSVFSESKCLSLANCSKETLIREDEKTHTASADAITLAYPQWNALIAVEKVLKSASATTDEKNWAEQALSAARNSPVREVAERADRFSLKLRTRETN